MPLQEQKFVFADKQAKYYKITNASKQVLPAEVLSFYASFDAAYRALCAVLYNFVPMSGHPGGSISSGKIVSALVFNTMDYQFSNPARKDADILCYAAGHKAMGLYALYALRDELMAAAKQAQDININNRLRLEDLLGFRRNGKNSAPLFKKFNAKTLDGHPSTPTPFVKVATGASGVGVGSGLGLALAQADTYVKNTPKTHIIEGEAGLTPGRVSEALAFAATSQLDNAVLHIDWNQSSIDSDRVTAENGQKGDYVQWTPAELCFVNGWNVIEAENGLDLEQVITAQNQAGQINNGLPTAIIYRTVKGWKYGIEGKGSHGAGHKYASEEFYKALEDFEQNFNIKFPRFCNGDSENFVEECFWNTLLVIREAFAAGAPMVSQALKCLENSHNRLNALQRTPRDNMPALDNLYKGSISPQIIPEEFNYKPGSSVLLRDALANALGYINNKTGGALLVTSADLAGSTSIKLTAQGFGKGYYNKQNNPSSRLVAVGGICEDAMGAVMSGVSAFGSHIGVTSSYAAFIAPLEHICARLHAIGQQNKHQHYGQPQNTFIMVNAHASIKTGEDGPTHADPQALQLLQDNFPLGSMITLTPWDPAEIWPLITAALLKRPAVIAPFVTRPAEIVPNRALLKTDAAALSVNGMYYLRKALGKPDGTVVLQGGACAMAFVNGVLPLLEKEGYNINAYYVSSSELFAMLNEAEREAIYPAATAKTAMAVTDFTLASIAGKIHSSQGLKHSLYPFKNGLFLGSAREQKICEEAGLCAKSQFAAIKNYIHDLKSENWL